MAKILLQCKGIFTKTSLFFIGFLLAFSGWAQTSTATVDTDKDDYAPGEYVIITGTGWEPGERVDFTFVETPKPETCVNSHDHYAITDANGNIYFDQFLIKINHLGVHFVLTATGESSGKTAVTEFTDGILSTVTVGTQSGIATQGTASSVTYSVSLLKTGGGSESYNLTITGLPAGASGSFATNPLNLASGNNSTNGTTLTISTNASLSSGPYTFTVTGTNTISNLAADNKSATGTLVVNSPACTAPSITSTGTVGAVTYSGSAQTTTLPYTATTNSPTSYTIDWNGAANTAGLPDQGSTNHTFSSGAGSMTSIAVPALLPAGSYLGVVTITNACGLSGTKNVSLTVNKAPSITTVTITGAPFTYTGSAITPATVTVTGAGGLSLTPAPVYVNNTDAGTANASYSYAESANHLASSDSEDFTIDKADAAITVTAYTGTYDALAHGATGSATGVEGETLAGLDLGASFTNVPGGQADWTFTDVTGNYNDDAGSVQIVIGKADAAITVTGYTGTYDSAAHGATGSATGVDAGGAASGSTLDLGASFSNVPGGTANWTFTGGTNYTDQSGTAAIVINKATAVVTVNGYTGTYDAAAHGATGSATGVDAGGAASGSTLDLGASFTNVPGGTANWSFTGGTNYTDQSGTAAIVINRKSASVTPNAASRFCGQVDPGFTGTLNGFLAGDGVTANYSRTAGESVGSGYVINATLSPAGILSNYDITYNTAIFTIDGVTIDASLSSVPVPLNPNGATSALLQAFVSQPGVMVSFYLNGSVVAACTATSATTPSPNGFYLASCSVTNLVIGVYKIEAVAGNNCASSIAYMPIYDANGSFVTGGGWIMSPVGAYKTDLTLTGKANFGFVSKYKKGSSQVEGNTEFQFKAGDLNFKSMLHESGSLVISGKKATYRGDGTINGVPGFKFTLVALDGDFNGGTGPDQFRIKIWGASGIIYDNGLGADDNSDFSTVLGGGSIVIHKPNGKTQEVVTKGTPIIMEDLKPEILETLAVSPNPVVSESTIRFSIKEDANVILRVYDYSGRMIETLFNGSVNALENYDVEFQRRNLMSGIYILKLTTATGHSYDKRIIVE